MNKSKTFMIVSIITLVIAIIGSASTYAWYAWNSSEEDQTKIVTSVGTATIYYDSGSSITGVKIRPVDDKSNGIVKVINIKSDKVLTDDLTFDLYLDITSLDNGLKDVSFRYALYKDTDTTPIKEGNFSQEYLNSNIIDCNVNTGVKHIVLLDDELITTTMGKYTLYIWIDGANYTNPDTMQNQTFTFDLHASGEDAIVREGKQPDITKTIEGSLAYDLVSLYNNSEPTDVINNGIVYHYDTEHRLMSDIGANLRFYGADDLNVSDDLNNYIYFNCSDYNNQSSSTCEVWRIIGVFDSKVKIMRGSSIGTYSWDNKTSGIGSSINDGGSNDWTDSRLMMLLNPGYDINVFDSNNNLLNEHNRSYYWNSTGTSSSPVKCYLGKNNATKDCYFADKGLKNNTTRGLISETLWYLKGHNSASVFSDQIYEYERTTGSVYNKSRATLWTGRIALPYPSDYGYAADFMACNVNLTNYGDTLCTSVNWMKSTIATNFSFLLTSCNYNSYGVWMITWSGMVRENYNVVTNENYFILPTLYLNPELSVKSGDGSQNTPYQLEVS